MDRGNALVNLTYDDDSDVNNSVSILACALELSRGDGLPGKTNQKNLKQTSGVHAIQPITIEKFISDALKGNVTIKKRFT